MGPSSDDVSPKFWSRNSLRDDRRRGECPAGWGARNQAGYVPLVRSGGSGGLLPVSRLLASWAVAGAVSSGRRHGFATRRQSAAISALEPLCGPCTAWTQYSSLGYLRLPCACWLTTAGFTLILAAVVDVSGFRRMQLTSLRWQVFR